MTVPTTDAEARAAAIRVGGKNNLARVKAYRRFRMLLPPSQGGFDGYSDRWHALNRYWTGITRKDEADAMQFVIEAEYETAVANFTIHHTDNVQREAAE